MNKKPLSLPLLLGALLSLFIFNQIFITTGFLQASWLDIPMHFFGGTWIGLVELHFLSFCFNNRQKIPSFLALITTLITVIIVGLIWEVFEFNSGIIPQLKLAEIITCEDTLGDLLLDAAGAFAAWVYFIIFKDRTGQKFSSLLDKK